MKILLVDNESNEMDIIERLLKLNNCKFSLTNYKKCIKHIEKDVDGLILTGSKHNAKSLLPHEEKVIIEAIKKNIPILGICGGHQVIGLFFGGKLGKQRNRVKGFFKINIISKKGILKGLPNSTMMYESHIHNVSLPKNFTLLATSNKTKNEAMKMNGKQVYSIQFHPSMSGYYGEMIFKNFIKICGKK